MRGELAAERQLFSTLSIEQMEEWVADSKALVGKMMAMVKANAASMLIGVSPSPAEGVVDVTSEPTTQSTAPTVSDQPMQPVRNRSARLRDN